MIQYLTKKHQRQPEEGKRSVQPVDPCLPPSYEQNVNTLLCTIPWSNKSRRGDSLECESTASSPRKRHAKCGHDTCSSALDSVLSSERKPCIIHYMLAPRTRWFGYLLSQPNPLANPGGVPAEPARRKCISILPSHPSLPQSTRREIIQVLFRLVVPSATDRGERTAMQLHNDQTQIIHQHRISMPNRHPR